MKIGVPKETAPQETRVALTPETAGKLIRAGFQISVQAGAGENSFFTDQDFAASGCEIIPDVAALLAQSEIILKVQKPTGNEVGLMPENSTLIGFLQPSDNDGLTKRLAEKKITAFSMDSIPRTTRAQTMDALSSMSTIAGYKAVLLAADTSPRFFPMLTTAAGTVTPAKVFVIGAGVAGLQAIATARRLGAIVEAFDTRPAVKEQVESLGARFAQVDWKLDSSEAQDKGGYAKALSAELHQKEEQLLALKIRESDIVITTALIPGKPAPCLITQAMIQSMKPGSVIVDLAAEAGGNCALAKPNEKILQHGVTIIGYLNLPALMPYHASQMYSRNIAGLLTYIVRENKLALDWSDEIIAGACLTHEGKILKS